MDLTYEQRRKERFVTGRLASMLREATHGEVSMCFYRAKAGNEIVTVLMANGAAEANVTGDSLWAIAKDVMRAVGKRYE